MREKAIRCILLIWCLAVGYGCSVEEERVAKLAASFAKAKKEYVELREVLINLSESRGVRAFRAGEIIRYNETEQPARLWFRAKDGPFNFADVVMQERPEIQDELRSLQAKVSNLGCKTVDLEAGSSFWVTMHEPGLRGPDFGYVHVGQLPIQKNQGERHYTIPGMEGGYYEKPLYYAIQGESEWFVFVR